MNLSVAKLKNSLIYINSTLKSDEIQQVIQKSTLEAEDVDLIVEKLCELMRDDPKLSVLLRKAFSNLSFPIAAKLLNSPDISFEEYQRKCIAISFLAENNVQILRYSLQYFQQRPAPFSNPKSDRLPAKKKAKLTENVSELEIVQMALRFLKQDVSFFRRVWNWEEFIEQYHGKGCDLQKFYCNQISSMLFGMSLTQQQLLNANIPKEIYIKTELDDLSFMENSVQSKCDDQTFIEWKFKSNEITCIEGVFLPIYNKTVMDFFDSRNDIVKVESTKINLKSLALGISSGKAICLTGGVGCGKTTLVEYMAKAVGRLTPNQEDYSEYLSKESELLTNGNKRKLQEKLLQTQEQNNLPKSGFLRVQLGDQTDSKVLLGQYRCTDTPGEFIWQPGVLTQAVMNGDWLLLEDIDLATQDVCTVLTNLLENNFLSVPGFREYLKITPGFQLFVTLRTQNAINQSSNSVYSLLEKHLYTINIISLSRIELAEIICKNYPKLATVARRIVDVFLIFSSGGHRNENESYEFQMASKKREKKDTEEVLPYVRNTPLTNILNSGRLVSTRDLLKLCKRSNSTFQVTSTECAYLVFQNCVDLFCSHLPAGQLKTDLIINIGARLGIIETRCIHLANEFKPTVKLTLDDLVVGRASLCRNSKEIYEKRIKLSNTDEAFSKLNLTKTRAPTFSFTRVSSCILERIAVAVQQNEAVLLVGETGTGKTSSVQYLAHQTNHKLVVVNMNNQSDVSDLIGGYKPVDISFVITPLRNEFEKLFAKTFDILKNEKFLSHIAGCFNRADYVVLIKLMLKVIDNAYKILNEKEKTVDYRQWQILEQKLKKLNQQLKTSANLSFAFIPGSLVNCIRNGDWVLLDEINLASAETLECLSTILEPDGSIILLERGDFVPVTRHPDFRIFSCMNPSTDVGKKDLPVGIRNRFTEFFVDELTVENDLLILVGDYLNNTGIEKSRIHKTVQLYMELRKLSQLELNDGLGNKPVFSLRTLCRALRICSKNLCGSTERNIYESFCLSFLTQLDAQSHDEVVRLIQKYLVSDVKMVLSQQIPRPPGDQINFEGYWIESGEKEPLECKEYILTESVKKNLKDLARIISIGKLPILLQGPTSAGKTSLIEYIAKRSGNHCLRINNHEHTDLQEYIGTYVADVTGKLSFQEGILVKAMREGYWIILDELNLAPSDILEALNRVLDDNRELYIPETQVVVKAHPNFMLFATQNPPGLYGGRKTLSRAFKNRFIELHFSEIPKKELEIILEKRCLIPMKYAQKMVKTMSSLQVNRRTTSRNNFTLRDLFRWGNRYTYADKKLLGDRNYDWNQHLVDEGYLVLSAKIRNQIENEIITDTLLKNFSKKISVENLFSLNNDTSMVTREILESLQKYNGAQQIVWTYEMRRMAVLVSKSLQFNEPVLLVGLTGCGKTTVCQILAEIVGRKMRILNCHMHTEGADFLGGLRPCRESKNDKKQLFEWSDGPLVLSMTEGSFFLADEISLAEDSVLERLNCVLEPDRTLLLAEKGGVDENIIESSKNSEFVVKAADGFQFLATMNPGGDFGKKELSPALRNRFTEIWCAAICDEEDMMKIAENAFKNSYESDNEWISKISQVIIKTVCVLKKNVEKLNFSIRDVLAWVNYIAQNYAINGEECTLNINEALLYGLHTIFLDALEMLPYENLDDAMKIRKKTINAMEMYAKQMLDAKINFSTVRNFQDAAVRITAEKFGIDPFYLDINSQHTSETNCFSFSAPTTKHNLFRVLSALTLKKAILLEGAPGVGKSSLIENIAKTIGYNVVRINLCEHTDLADLFGTDLPAESSILDGDSDDKELQLGSFVWRDGPLLSALKASNTWILLDELNLAPQSVLEGLNSILDHRGEVYIPELNKTFKLGKQTKIFATQNPLRQGGGRKGLPQSFLNRFTKVYLQKLTKIDLLHVVTQNFGALEDDNKILKDFKILERMVNFSEELEKGIANIEFGFKGGPFEANLRDMLRWCYLITNSKTGFNVKATDFDLNEFLLILLEKMKLVYCERLRTESDVAYVFRKFADMFESNIEQLQKESTAISFFWNDEEIFMNDIQCNRLESECDLNKKKYDNAIILSSQLQTLKHISECVMIDEPKPIILCGPTDCGKTKIINTFCAMFNKKLNLDTIDDSVTGSFQQFDFNRMLEEVWQKIEVLLNQKLIQLVSNALNNERRRHISNLLKLSREFDETTEHMNSKQKTSEIEGFCKRLDALHSIIENLKLLCDNETNMMLDKMLHELSVWKNFLQNSNSSLNTGGHFEWVDSVIVKAIKFGHFICLEHVNLVSSAVLDRLNPILEQNGTLMISEKGVNSSNEPEIVEKHKNFRIFLTFDPKHGEVSRAMKNRCIELSISHQNYTEDDLRKMIFLQGVENVYLMRAIIDIHKSVQSLTEFSNFGVSHVVKMAFLVAQNKSLHSDDKYCLLTSAMEVYVRSSIVDLLGFGLPYYRSQLKDKIVDVISKIVERTSFVNYKNFIVHSNDLSTINLIKLQFEPLISFLRCADANGDYTQVLCDLSSQFGDLKTEDFETVTKLLLALFYILCSPADLDSRYLYVRHLVSTDSNHSKLSEKLYAALKKYPTQFKNSNIPWNSKLLPRLRPYRLNEINTTAEYKIMLSLYLEALLKNIEVKKSVQLSDIDAMTYSKALEKKIFADTLGNKLIAGLYKIASQFGDFLSMTLKNSQLDVNKEEYVKLLLSFEWFNRLLDVSAQKLFVNKNLISDLVDELNLHFKWLAKHCINKFGLEKDDSYLKIVNDVQNSILSQHHTLQLYKKIYMKSYITFLPIYEEQQAEILKNMNTLVELTRIVPKMNELREFEDYQKRLVLLMSENYQSFKRMLFNSDSIYTNEILSIFGEYIERKLKFKEDSNGDAFLLLSRKIAEYEQFLKQDLDVDFRNDKFYIEILPIFEYFIVKSLPFAQHNLLTLNEDFLLKTPSITCDSLVLFKMLSSESYKHILELSIDNDSTEFNKKYRNLLMMVEHEIQNTIHNSMAINDKFCRTYSSEENYKAETSQLFVNNSLLTSNVLSSLIDKNGCVRETGLGEVNQWKLTLKQMRNLLWSNVEIMCAQHNSLEISCNKNCLQATEMLENIKCVKEKSLSIENENFSDFNKEFWRVVYILDEKLKDTTSASWLKNFVIESLSAIIKLNLMSYFPLIDPVKKNKLKSKYIQEDMHLLQSLLQSYKFMAVVMSYDNLGEEHCELYRAELDVLERKLLKHSKKVALRPDVCKYSSLVKAVNHFLASCCHPKQLLDLIIDIQNLLLQNHSKEVDVAKIKTKASELMSKVDLWIINAEKFSSHVLLDFNIYYRDFIAPIEYSLMSLKNGLKGMRSLLLAKHDGIVSIKDDLFKNCNGNHELSSLIKKLFEFPVSSNYVLSANELSIIECINDGPYDYFKLVKANFQEVLNSTSITCGKLSPSLFNKLDGILNIYNQIWQQQEELKRKRQIEEDSLYVTKTKCVEEDDEARSVREISELFPDSVTNDFEEFSKQESLEQIIKVDTKSKKIQDIISDDDYKLIGDFFIDLMSDTKSIQKNFLHVFEEKVKVFYSMFEKFKACLDDGFDKEAYKSLSLMVALCQETYGDINLQDLPSKNYNFYKDSNINEATTCIEAMNKLEARVKIELEQWPDHAVLNDILIIINRVRSFSSNSPIVRFNVGMQILRQKVNEWNRVAHRLNNFKDNENEIASIILRWMQMELQCWRESLNQTYELAKSKAYRYWFFLYNLIHEFLNDGVNAIDLTDIKKVEKRFSGEDIDEEKPATGSVSLAAVTNVLKQFLESSNYAEFKLRMDLLKAFQHYLSKLQLQQNETKKIQLVAVIHNLHSYFAQFVDKVQLQIDFVRKPIEDKLRKFVKINSFDKDLSYFSTESNIKQVHRNLHKHLKEFDVEIKKKISDLFVYRESNTDDDHQNMSHQVSLSLSTELFVTSDEIPHSKPGESFHDILKYTTKSRDIVKKSLESTRLIELNGKLQEVIETELENYNHLRCLKVNENLPRPKQKSQAKSFLNQKRKALTEFFKTITTFGLNYKTGLLNKSLNAELLDLEITPYNFDEVKFSSEQLSNFTNKMSEKLDLYFNKSVFKMKLLMNALLVPRTDIDYGFQERIKGFSVDLFTLVQEQKKNFAHNINEMKTLNQFITDMNTVKLIKNPMKFDKEHQKLKLIEESFVHAVEVLEQFKLLMKCAPESNEKDELKVVMSQNSILSQKSPIYDKIRNITDETLSKLQRALMSIHLSESKFCVNLSELVQQLSGVNEALKDLKKYLIIDAEISVYGEPIVKLIEELTINLERALKMDTDVLKNESFDVEPHLEKLSNAILLSIQNIYKEFSNSPEVSEDDELQESHLKEKLNAKIVESINILNIKKVNAILSNAMLILFSYADINSVAAISKVLPLINQYKLLMEYFLIQQLTTHKLSARMLSIMLSVFLQIAKNGFCIPENLLSDEEQKQEGDSKTGEGFGFEDGDGEKDVSNKLESEDQLDEAKRPEDYNKGDQEEKDCKEEKGIDMNHGDFEGKMHDVPENDSDDEQPNSDNEEIDKEMGETGEGADKLDDQIWGSDEENEPEDTDQDQKDEKGKGSGEKDDTHNDLESAAENPQDSDQQQEENGLDATAEKEERKQNKKDINHMNEQSEGEEEEQSNPFHNQFEDPPEAEDFDLDEQFNLDGEEKDPKEPENEINPFDIDTMKEQMDPEEQIEPDSEMDTNEKSLNEENSSDSENETQEKFDENQSSTEDIEEDQTNLNEDTPQQPDEIDPDESLDDQKDKKELSNDFHESRDKQSKEDNIQAMPNQKEKSSSDQIQAEKIDENVQQQNEMNDQDTGEDRDALGQAENKESKSGHQGVANTKERNSSANRDDSREKQKRKKGNTDQDRTLGDVSSMEKKSLKTIEKMNREEAPNSDDECQSKSDEEKDEYQHVKNAQKSDKTTFDNATEEQSKKVQHDEEKNSCDENLESREDLMEVDENTEPEVLEEKIKELQSEKTNEKSKKNPGNDKNSKERLENQDVEIDGEDVVTFNVPRGDETTAHCQMDVVNDSTMCEEQSNAEILELRKLLEAEIASTTAINPDALDMEKWQDTSNRMMTNARDLCEQLRLILEPTKCTRLKGDYRTGRRINMKKIIPYIASQFRKDKIWLRRTKAAQRDYKITIAVDDSKSMDHNNSKELTLQAISLVSQALTLLESGKLSVVSFGEASKIILKYNEQFNGPKLIKSLTFSQNKTKIADLLDFTRIMNQESSSSDNSLFEHLLIVLSDGRNIFSEGEKRVRNAIKMARLQRMFIVYIIIDNPDNKDSILDIRTVLPFTENDKTTRIVSYMDLFPFPYYVIVRDLNQLPMVLSDGLRQWFELVSSEL